VFRLIPPLIITRKEADTALTILEEVFRKMN
jgi:4-aminobutyrate aminotransferase-like enzyme